SPVSPSPALTASVWTSDDDSIGASLLNHSHDRSSRNRSCSSGAVDNAGEGVGGVRGPGAVQFGAEARFRYVPQLGGFRSLRSYRIHARARVSAVSVSLLSFRPAISPAFRQESPGWNRRFARRHRLRARRTSAKSVAPRTRRRP